MNYNINSALAVAASRDNRRISRTYANEPILFALVERGLAVWNSQFKGSVTVTKEAVAAWEREERLARIAARKFIRINAKKEPAS
jgi:DNA-binding transcriptional regulator YiaG